MAMTADFVNAGGFTKTRDVFVAFTQTPGVISIGDFADIGGRELLAGAMPVRPERRSGAM